MQKISVENPTQSEVISSCRKMLVCGRIVDCFEVGSSTLSESMLGLGNLTKKSFLQGLRNIFAPWFVKGSPIEVRS